MLRICLIVFSLLVAVHGAKCCAAQPPKDEKKRLAGEKATKDAAVIRLDAYGDPLPARALFRLGTIRLQHQDWLNHAVFSPDGKVLAAASIGEKQVVLWEMPSGRMLTRLLVAGKYSKQLLFSPDGRWLASIGGDFYDNPFLHVWEVAGGKPVIEAVKAEASWRAFAFAPDSKLLAVADAKDIRLWDLPAAKERQRQRTPPGKALALTFAAGRLTALMDEANTLAVWDVKGGKKRYSFAGAEKASKLMGGKGVFCATFSPDGELFAYGGSDSFVTVRDLEKGQQLHRFQGHLDAISWVSFSADSRTVLSCSWHDRPRLWDLAKSKEKIALDSDARSTFGEFSPDGKLMAMGGANANYGVRLCDPATGKDQPLGPTHQTPISSVSFSPDGKWLATAAASSGDSVVRLWDVSTGRQMREFAGHKGGVTSVSFSPDGKTLATAGWMGDATVRLWNSQTGQLRRKFEGNGAGKGDAFFFPDGKFLAAADWHTNATGTCDVKVWEVASGKETLHLSRPRDSAPHIALSPDGQTLAVAYSAEDRQGKGELKNEVKMYDAKSGQPRRWLPKIPGRPWRLAFSPDGRTLAVSAGPTVLYEIVSQRELIRLPICVSFAFSSNGRFVALSAHGDGIRIHDLVTGKVCLTLEGHPGFPESYAGAMAFSPDGACLVSGGRDGVAIIWHVADLDKIAPLRPDREVNANALEEWWSDLIRLDAKTANRALWNFVAAGDAAIPFLKEKLRADATTDAKQVAKLIADLGSENFAVRTRASKELEGLAEAAEESLQRALEDKPVVETRRGIEQILAKLNEGGGPTEYLRANRALGALERIPGPQSYALVESLAKGRPEARLTRDAQKALQRRQKYVESK